ncbi:dynamin family protein [Actinobacillus delphinicola]|uniref:Dynamin family n=1 Tax=Actinobacillus delphinicola TaxID=51161 RepID=A0A448TVU9_9PAST|nr:dynamin family protein [Actinobacillus delphinicola]VEJ10066.1 Dynamin family [Actinobacillus delphinicola]
MEAKQILIDYVQNIQHITQPVDIKLPFNIDELITKIKEKELIVPVVGAFSAGKSTLINSMLGRNILPTNITAETALATELRYGTEEYIEAYTTESDFERFALTDFEKIKNKSEDYQFLKLFLNNPKLKEIEPLVLVDMPGFESPIANHHQAILNYLNRGVYFVFLTSVLDGTITRSMLQEIHNTQMVGKGYSFCLSKTNLRSPETVAEVRDQLARQLATQCDYHEPIILLDDNGGENLHKILLSINPDDLFKKVFLNTLQDNFFQLEENINVKISALNASREENIAAKTQLETTIRKLQQQKNTELENLKRYENKLYIDNIIDGVVNAIQSHEYRLVSTVLSSGMPQFENELSAIVKDSLLAGIQQFFAQANQQMLQGIERTVGASLVNVKGFDFNESGLSDLGSTINSTVGVVQEVLTQLIGVLGPGMLSTIMKFILQIVSHTMLPVVSTVLGLLASLFSGGNSEQDQRRRISDVINHEIIPVLRSKLRETLQPQIAQGLAEMMSQITIKFEERLAGYQAEIQQILDKEASEKAQRVQQVEALKQVRDALSVNARNVIF